MELTEISLTERKTLANGCFSCLRFPRKWLLRFSVTTVQVYTRSSQNKTKDFVEKRLILKKEFKLLFFSIIIEISEHKLFATAFIVWKLWHLMRYLTKIIPSWSANIMYL